MMGMVLRLRMAEHTSKPEAPGMLMSRIAMSGASASKRWMAEGPSGAFTTRYPACPNA